MQWRTVFVIAGITGSAVICITHYRGPKPAVPDPIAVFRRILTVTNLMCLAGNKPGEPKLSTNRKESSRCQRAVRLTSKNRWAKKSCN